MVHGFGLWVSAEMLTLLTITYACGSVLWVMAPEPDRDAPPVSRWLVMFGLGFLLVVVLAVIVENPADRLLVAQYDRISVVHAAMAILALCSWVFIDQLWRRAMVPAGVIGRSSVLAIAGAAALVVMYVIYPDFFRGPLGRVDPALKTLLFDVTGEMMPIQRHSLSVVYGNLGLNPLALPLAVWLAVAQRRDWRRASIWLLSQPVLPCLWGYYSYTFGSRPL
jgi:hypothetical protein